MQNAETNETKSKPLVSVKVWPFKESFVYKVDSSLGKPRGFSLPEPKSKMQWLQSLDPSPY